MDTLLFATGNANKVIEIKEMLPAGMSVKSLKDVGFTEEVPETTGTIEGNAIQKARFIAEKLGMTCFSEDTGLEVFSLDMAPGVDTAYYAGPQRDANDNMDLLLKNLKPHVDRSARFRTVIALVSPEGTKTFEGIVNGRILLEKKGTGGFGYDPIFCPDGYEQTFAELPSEIKNTISHRGRAFKQFLAYLNQFSVSNH